MQLTSPEIYRRKKNIITERHTNYQIKTNSFQPIYEMEMYTHIRQLKNEISLG